MATAMTPDQQARLQGEIQAELERREWAEPEDNVMAEYITVLLANGSSQERVQTEMDDLVGSDFDPRFLSWLFEKAQDITAPAPAPAPVAPSTSITSDRPSSTANRLFSSATAGLSSQPEKRKLENGSQDGQNKKRLSEGAPSAPSGPRAMGQEGRSLQDRLGPNRGGRGGLHVRGMAGGGGGGRGGGMGRGPMGGFQQGFGQGVMQPGFGFFAPGQQEMMAQMMMMQANMAQMGEMMAQMVEEKQQVHAQPAQPVRPVRPPPVKLPHGTKLGGHSVSAITPKSSATLGPIPDKPTSKALCRYSVGCSNARCPYSHPSPVADEKTGMVLSEEACENGKNCKDSECTKSHVSPAAVLGETAGPSRMLCKYQSCTNPSCPFRHEDADGNPIPPPALTAAKAAKSAKAKEVAVAPHPSSDGEEGDMEVVVSSKGLMDGALGEGSQTERACRYGERCTRADCKFSHPPSRPTPRSASRSTPRSVTGGMNVSKKFGSVAKLDPSAGEFKPKDKELQVSM